MNSITVNLSTDTAARLDRLADKLARPTDSVAAEAIEAFVAREEWQLAEIEAGLAEADHGDFATEDEVKAVLSRFSFKSQGRVMAHPLHKARPHPTCPYWYMCRYCHDGRSRSRGGGMECGLKGC
jgi:predicted transcriptional regulator